LISCFLGGDHGVFQGFPYFNPGGKNKPKKNWICGILKQAGAWLGNRWAFLKKRGGPPNRPLADGKFLKKEGRFSFYKKTPASIFLFF